ncbi:MAG: hypothetical protein ACKESB_03485 [Candidatus Hodgkinia cicadicola]
MLAVSISEDVMQEMRWCGGYVASWEGFPPLMTYAKRDLWTTRVTRVCSTSEYWISAEGPRRTSGWRGRFG